MNKEDVADDVANILNKYGVSESEFEKFMLGLSMLRDVKSSYEISDDDFEGIFKFVNNMLDE